MFNVLRVAVWCVMRAGQWSTAMGEGGGGVIDWLILSSLGCPWKIFPRGNLTCKPSDAVPQFDHCVESM